MKVALTAGGGSPEEFTKKEIKEATRHGVILQAQSSETSMREYMANACEFCDAFVGDFYIFANYYTEALYGRLAYEQDGIMHEMDPEYLESIEKRKLEQEKINNDKKEQTENIKLRQNLEYEKTVREFEEFSKRIKKND
jgi:hypothetical protein